MYILGRSDNAIKNRWHLLKRASKLAAKQPKDPTCVTATFLLSLPHSHSADQVTTRASDLTTEMPTTETCSERSYLDSCSIDEDDLKVHA